MTDCDWQEIMAAWPSKSYVRKREPCMDCISRVMCLNKPWMEILDMCDELTDYIGYMTRNSPKLKEPPGELAHIKGINQIFTVHATKDEEIIMIGKYWSPTLKKGGEFDTMEMGPIAQQFKLATVKDDNNDTN